MPRPCGFALDSCSIPYCGLTGIMLAAAPFNWQLGGSYFVVAHFHYMIVGGILFALFGASITGTKMTGRMLDEDWANGISGCSSSASISLSTSCTFGCSGHATTHLHLRAGRGWEIWNLIVTWSDLPSGGCVVLCGESDQVVLPGAPVGAWSSTPQLLDNLTLSLFS